MVRNLGLLVWRIYYTDCCSSDTAQCHVLTVSWVGLQCVIVVFPDHTHLLFHFDRRLDRLMHVAGLLHVCRIYLQLEGLTMHIYWVARHLLPRTFKIPTNFTKALIIVYCYILLTCNLYLLIYIIIMIYLKFIIYRK